MRTRTARPLVLLPVLCLALASFLPTEPDPAARSAARPAADGKYIGAGKCESCHSSKESGNPYEVWSSARHAGAFDALSSAEAKEIASARGIADPSKDDQCVKCHVTGHGEPEDAFKRGFKMELGVQCESCHGPAEDHMKARFKAAAMGGKPKTYEATPEGEVIVSPEPSLCTGCHNPQSPTYQSFCYFEARGKIAHLDPRKPRTEEELASYGTCPSGDPCQHAEGCPEGRCNLTPEQLASMKK